MQHVVVVTMENRSFDHFLGWLRGADGRQAGLSFTDHSGSAHATYPLAPDYTGCGHPDPDHSYGPSRVAWNNGAMDGFLRAGSNDVYSIGYYTEPDLPFLGALAQHYLVCDRCFASILGPTFPNRMFLWAAQTDRLDDSVSTTSLPTIFDSLSAAGVSHRYYFNNLPFLALWSGKYVSSTSLFQDFLTDAASGALPAVSFIDPTYTLLDNGTGNDDHPHADIRNGEAFLAAIFQALAGGPAWPGTVLIITFDEWGGFFDHVPPPRAAAPNNVDQDLVNGQALLGFRVPAIVVSPFTRNQAPFLMASREAADGYAAAPGFTPRPPRRRSPAALVNHTVFDHTSVLKLIEWRWGLPPLTARDGSPQIGNLAVAMNFSAPDSTVPALPNPAPVGPQPCSRAGSRLAGVEAEPQVQQSPWTALAGSPAAQDWLQHPNFRRRIPQ
ncbi:MAG TPA: alkaline phosphatase family protein [Bryobacterales bacterium]|nr:alkaline phosphatase family protein [Bryobacterales bacterium]